MFAQVCTYSSYQRYVSLLFQHLSRDPPPGYSRCSVAQLARADRLVFEKIIERDIKPRRKADGRCPLDEALLAALESYEVSMCLLPLAAGSVPNKPGKREAPSKGQGRRQNFTKFHKGSGKGKRGSSAVPMPKALVDLGGKASTPDGKSICFNFNLDGCSRPECKRAHVCARCFKSGHGAKACN